MARAIRRTLAVVAALAVVPAFACVIADPPAEIPVPPLSPPYILDDQVEPPLPLLGSWPLEFEIPIEVQDPTTPVEWRAFLDYDPVARSGFFKNGVIDPDPAAADAGVRLLSTRLEAPSDMTACHTLQILVALTFDEDHTPDSIGGDSITWIYTPTGSLADCPVYDAGPYDAGVDASDASDPFGSNGVDASDAGDGAVE